ncbi:hypothetical protein HDF15_001082 [Granulicella mallensis]|uniref:Uncharacterized protein n=1 Tax=Granulicella mallensis TaxID=940614 RepID=A0A7W7ZMM7_9BACT|nr:hypothetical protein [Granulicella mallensis]
MAKATRTTVDGGTEVPPLQSKGNWRGKGDNKKQPQGQKSVAPIRQTLPSPKAASAGARCPTLVHTKGRRSATGLGGYRTAARMRLIPRRSGHTKIFRRPARHGSASDGRTGFENECKRTVNDPASDRGCVGHKLRLQRFASGQFCSARGTRSNTGTILSRHQPAVALFAQLSAGWGACPRSVQPPEVRPSLRSSVPVRIQGGCHSQLSIELVLSLVFFGAIFACSASLIHGL